MSQAQPTDAASHVLCATLWCESAPWSTAPTPSPVSGFPELHEAQVFHIPTSLSPLAWRCHGLNLGRPAFQVCTTPTPRFPTGKSGPWGVPHDGGPGVMAEVPSCRTALAREQQEEEEEVAHRRGESSWGLLVARHVLKGVGSGLQPISSRALFFLGGGASF